mgnify:CR=1 FL=1
MSSARPSVKKLFTCTRAQAQFIEVEAKRLAISQAGLVRRIFDDYMERTRLAGAINRVEF